MRDAVAQLQQQVHAPVHHGQDLEPGLRDAACLVRYLYANLGQIISHLHRVRGLCTISGQDRLWMIIPLISKR